MLVLLTGGAGYIGSHANRLLQQQGIETLILDDLRAGHAEAVLGGQLIQGDVGDRVLLDRLFSEYSIDAVMHFAAYTSVPESVEQPAKYYRNNVVNMQALLDACIAHGVKYFIYSSSAASFGLPQYLPMDEEHPQCPINPYGMSKYIGERMLSDYERAYGLRYCAFRYFCAAGDSHDSRIGESHQPEGHLIPVMIRAARENRPFSVFGTDYNTRDGSCIRDFIHVEDLAQAHWLGLQYLLDGGASDCFNLGSSTGFTVLEMIRELEQVTGQPVPYLLAPRRAGDPPVLVASCEKAKQVLHWQPDRSEIRRILQDAWNWEKYRSY